MDFLDSRHWDPAHDSSSVIRPTGPGDDGSSSRPARSPVRGMAPVAGSAFGSLIAAGPDQPRMEELLAFGEISDEEPTELQATSASGNQPLQVHLFPTYATQHTAESWRVNVHGWVFNTPAAARLDPGQRWFGHRFSRNLICRALGLTEVGAEDDTEGIRAIFRRRRSLFFCKAVAGRQISVRVGDLALDAVCDAGGHFHASGIATEGELLSALGHRLLEGTSKHGGVSPAAVAGTSGCHVSTAERLVAKSLQKVRFGDGVVCVPAHVASAVERPGWRLAGFRRQQPSQTSANMVSSDATFTQPIPIDGVSNRSDESQGWPLQTEPAPQLSSSWPPWRRSSEPEPEPEPEPGSEPGPEPGFGAERRYQSRSQVLLVPVMGLSVISDIDDTIKVSNVLHKGELIRNTFLREFVPVKGMAALYTRWQRELGAAFHFVSSCPWQLQPELELFAADSGFPAASYHMKAVRLNSLPGSGDSLLSLFEKGSSYKPRHIDELLSAFPSRRFWLVGDSGEQDPETYAKVWRQQQMQESPEENVARQQENQRLRRYGCQEQEQQHAHKEERVGEHGTCDVEHALETAIASSAASTATQPTVIPRAKGEVERIMIRLVPGADNSEERWQRVFQGIPPKIVVFFSTPDELDGLLQSEISKS